MGLDYVGGALDAAGSALDAADAALDTADGEIPGQTNAPFMFATSPLQALT